MALQPGLTNSSLQYTEPLELGQIITTTFIYRKEVFIQDEANIQWVFLFTLRR
jgi:hypothetical protein